MRILFAFLLAIVTFATAAQERELYWDTLGVHARLEADGRLHVEETQRMVFTGDWNGGERSFNIRPRQHLAFGGMSRIDAQTGVEIPMSQGSLDTVDQWDYAEPHVIRWRARNTHDPAFNNTTITYVLRYALSNVLLQDGDEYVLDHDFAFPKRDGVIEHFRLQLDLDPAWQTSGPLQKTRTVERIPPGRSFVLRVPLRFTGEGVPEADGGLSKEARWMLLGLAGIPLLLLAYALLREKMLGRLEPPPAEITRGWLEQNLLRERPEIIGAMWDEHVGPAEVSATLARMVGEGRLESKVAAGEMDLTILTRRDLNAYEQALIDGLFFRGNHTSTSKIRSHYADSGFNPAETMSKELMQAVQERLPKGDAVKPWRLSTAVFALAIATLVYLVKTHTQYFMHSIFVLFGAMFFSILTGAAPNHWRTRKLLGLRTALCSMIPAAIVVSGVAYVVWRSAKMGSPDIPMEFQLALTVLALWIFTAAIYALRSRESRESIAFLKMLGAAREYFLRELKKERPALDDAWYPYILAFGLNDDVERWFKAFPGASDSRSDDRWSSSSTSSTSSSSSGSSFSPSSWSGGGGAFGGAGASGMWAAAASGMAAGVAAPSSSSSDGGSSSSSSSSGGSSGGGGGGGW